MIYRRTERFKKAYRTLPEPIRQKVAKAFLLFQENPSHPSLGIKKVQGHAGIWEGRIDQQYRFTFHFEKDRATGDTICVFRNVDNHDECLKNP
jgi:mRNA-degrading endonuclease RelE of RelBE toxin-antitoxin system